MVRLEVRNGGAPGARLQVGFSGTDLSGRAAGSPRLAEMRRFEYIFTAGLSPVRAALRCSPCGTMGRDVPGRSLVMLTLSEFETDCMAALTALEDTGVPLGVLRYQPSDVMPPRTSSRQWLSRTTRAASRGCLGRQRAAGGCSHSGQSPRSMAARTARYCATLYPYFICMRAYVSYISFGADKGTFLHAQ